MKILFVDDVHRYEFLSDYNIQVVDNKLDAIKALEASRDITAVFVNVKFNNNFIETIKSINQHFCMLN